MDAFAPSILRRSNPSCWRRLGLPGRPRRRRPVGGVDTTLRSPISTAADATSVEDTVMTARAQGIYGHRARIGYTSPPLTTEIFPYEFYKIVPDGVTLVITTLAIVERSKSEVEQSYDISMKAARQMAAAGVDIVVLGGVPINLSRGYDNAEQMICDLEAELGIKISTSASAQAKAAATLGCKKAVVAQPYET